MTTSGRAEWGRSLTNNIIIVLLYFSRKGLIQVTSSATVITNYSVEQEEALDNEDTSITLI